LDIFELSQTLLPSVAHATTGNEAMAMIVVQILIVVGYVLK
jgi:hypothetical protein